VNLPKYDIEANNSLSKFTFVSIGPHGRIPKAVLFNKIGQDLYNLALGDINPDTGELDDLSRSDNGDMEKILATVSACIQRFTNKNPQAQIFMKGSTESRNRLYRRAISKYWVLIEPDFQVYGYIKYKERLFAKDSLINYEAFLIKPKKD
jgi:hypothetical protein